MNDIKLWEILVPTTRRVKIDGVITEVPNRVRYHRVWDAKVREIAGGLTILKPAKGQWLSATGELFDERMIPVRIACTEEQIMQVIDFTLKHYNQLAVMAYELSERVIIKHGTDS